MNLCLKEINRYFAERKSQLEWPRSKHNSRPSMAVDVIPYPIDWENKKTRRVAGSIIG